MMNLLDFDDSAATAGTTASQPVPTGNLLDDILGGPTPVQPIQSMI